MAPCRMPVLALGFERTLAYVTGLSNARDAIPFPRAPGNARNRAGSGQIVEVDVEGGGDLFQRLDGAFALSILDL
jgi:hypothetical protein